MRAVELRVAVVAGELGAGTGGRHTRRLPGRCQPSPDLFGSLQAWDNLLSMGTSRWVRGPLAGVLSALLSLAILSTGCSSTQEVTAAPAARSRAVKSPQWILDALRPTTSATEASSRSTSGSASALPSEADFTAGLVSAGLTQSAASCIYKAIADDPEAEALAPQLTALTSSLGASGSGPAIDPTALQPLLGTVAPCLDSATLLTMTNALSGTSGGQGQTFGAMLTSLLSNASDGSGRTPSLDLAGLRQLDGSSATPQQAAALAALLGKLPEILTLQNGQVDMAILRNLDLRSLNQDQARALLLIFANQLTAGQQAQLAQIANVNLQQLDLDVDVDKLSNEQRASLLLLVSPFISAGLKPLLNLPPKDKPADQIYVPKGLDLSNVNPLYFVPRENAIDGISSGGLSRDFAGCLYDRLRLLDPQTLGRAIIGTDTTGSLQLGLSILTCVVNGG